MNNTNTKNLSLQHPDSISSIDHTPPTTPVSNPKLLNTKNLSVDILKWNNFHDTNNHIPTIDVSPIYANNTSSQNNYKKLIVQKQTIKREQDCDNDSDFTDDRSCLMKFLMYLFYGDYP